MTLVPIIYTSLLIFSGLLLLVIILSYASFKMRSKGNTHGIHNHAMLIPVPVTNQVRLNKPINSPAQAYPFDQAKYEKRIQSQSGSLNNIRNSGVSSHIQDNTQNRHLRRIPSNENNRYEKNRVSENCRLVIMNTSEQLQRQSYFENSPVKNHKPAQSLTDMNLLDYYSDRGESGFVSLTTL